MNYRCHESQITGADGKTRAADVYQGITNDRCYQLLDIDGLLFVDVSHRPGRVLSNRITDWEPGHYAVAAHFRLH